MIGRPSNEHILKNRTAGLLLGGLLTLLLLLWLRFGSQHVLGYQLLQLTRSALQGNSSQAGHDPVDPYFEGKFPNWTDSVLHDLKATSLRWEYREQAAKLQLKSAHHVPFHWVLTSCDRTLWGRMVSTTLLSGLLNGLQPETVTIVWCKPYKEDEVPSLLYNLRHSHKLEVVYLAEQLPVKTASTFLMALLIPWLRKQPDLPLLVTEDDVLFVPDANAKLAELIHKASKKAYGTPYILNLYNPPKEPIEGDLQGVIDKYNRRDPRPLLLPDQPHSKAGAVKQSKMSYWYGQQGCIFSPTMTKYMLRHFYQVLTGQVNMTDGFGYGQDHIVKFFLEKYGCAFKYNPDAPCQVFNVEPSLIQHIGTSSATFNNSKPRFHLAVDYPMHVAFPGLDKPNIW